MDDTKRPPTGERWAHLECTAGNFIAVHQYDRLALFQ